MITRSKLLPHIVAVILIVVVNVFYFLPQMQGKVLSTVDIKSSDQATTALKEYRKEHGKTFLWNPAQFGGMPVLAGAPSKNNLVFKAYNLLKLGFSEPIGMFVAGSLMAYIMFISLGVNAWLSMFLSIIMLLTTSNVILWEAGHNSKIRTLIFTPLLIAGVLQIFEKKKYLLGFILLSLGFAFSFYTRHPQMTYYILLVFMIYGIIVLIQTIKNKDWSHFGKGTALVIVAVLLGGSTSATKLWSLYDYSEVTMRGDAILEADGVQTTPIASSSEVDGLSWEYAMQWSNDLRDIAATYIPGFVGGGSGQKVSRKSESFKNYKMRNAPMYWGNLPFTVGPMYIGASILFLFVFSLFVVKGNVKWWLGLGAIWMAILSMGKNAELINKLIFEIFPFYSKFRAPQSVLNIAPFFFALLAGLGLNQMLKTKFDSKKYKERNQKRYTKPLIISYAICGGFALLVALLGPSLFDFSSPVDPRYAQQGVDISVFTKDRSALMRGDAFRTFIIVSLIAGLLYAHIKIKIGRTLTIICIGLIGLIDMVGIDWRYLDHSKYITQRNYKESLEERLVDQQIKQLERNGRHTYRIHDLSIDSYGSSEASAAHNTIGGYDPAKMQRIEDLRNRHLNQSNMAVYNMLNTKYFIVPGQNGAQTIRPNQGALGNAWFVNNIQLVNTPNEEINALNGFDPRNTAIVLQTEFPDYTSGLSTLPDSLASIEIKEYQPDLITYNSSTSTEKLAVFSEMWYGPNKGWQVYIDGEKVDHIRVNYALRALRVPAGDHEITFEFRPKSYYMGETISLIGSIIMILAFFGFLYLTYLDSKRESES